MDPLSPRSDLDDRTVIVTVPVESVTEWRIVSSLTTLVTGVGGNGMKASPGSVLVVDTTPAGDAFGCNKITRMPGQTRLEMHRASLCTRLRRDAGDRVVHQSARPELN